MLRRSSGLKRTGRLRSVGKVTKARSQALAPVKVDLRARCRGRCENPFCRKHATLLDPHHILERSTNPFEPGMTESPETIVMLCRNCHNACDRDRPAPGLPALRVFPRQADALAEDEQGRSGPLIGIWPPESFRFYYARIMNGMQSETNSYYTRPA